MKVGMIDLDKKSQKPFPNLPLMKLSAWHKAQGDEVVWYDGTYCDLVYVSKVFSFSPDYDGEINAAEVRYGGSGFAISLINGKEVYDKSKDPPLPDEVEHIYPDYSLYGITDTAYGFIQRGCPRGCFFCHVQSMQGSCARKVADLSEFWNGQKNIVLLDPNITALKEWREVFSQLIDSGANVDFSQGLDIRLMTPEKTDMLMKMKVKSVHFAWDHYKDKDLVVPKLKEFREQSGWGRDKVSVYVLTNYDSTLDQDLERVMTIREIGFQPYIMRYDKEHIPRGSEINALARWVNFVPLFWKYNTFDEYKRLNRKGKQRMRIIRNYDVASYYPHLMTLYGYTSRNIPSPEIFSEVLESRMKAKAAGDTATANALKLVVNTTYGASLNKYNDLYDPLQGRSTCISGQLFLLELAQHLYKDIPDLRIVQLNTDGIMIEFDDSQYDQVQEILAEWQSRTGFELEEDCIAQIAQKDVNNYVEVQPSGKFKCKGGYLVRGISPAGAFNVNNNATIVAKALVEYFVNGTPPEETIDACDDIFQFQIIAKAGAKYREAYHLVGGEKVPVQKVNRIYATADPRYGKLFKVKAENDAEAKIEMLPEHCIIDNDNHLSITDVDKQFYIDMAKKRINDFMGIKPEKKGRKTKMANTTPKNVYQKLLEARAKFLEAGVGKSGKNMSLQFKYFELEDIVPVATAIFQAVGLIGVTNFYEGIARLDIVNTDDGNDHTTFSAPLVVSEGNKAVTPVQAMGATITYYRRYLYMMALDICEPDAIDPVGENPTPKPTPKPTAPVTPEQRQEVAKNLTAPEGNATELQIKGLKAALTKLREADPSKEDMIAQLAMQTNGFTNISKSDCEDIIKRVTAMLNPEVQ